MVSGVGIMCVVSTKRQHANVEMTDVVLRHWLSPYIHNEVEAGSRHNHFQPADIVVKA